MWDYITPDLFNGLFEFCGAVMLALNCFKLYRDKLVRGVHWMPTLFFFGWGVWNLYYYPHLSQWWSFAGGLAIVTVNLVWFLQIIYYTRRERRLLRARMASLRATSGLVRKNGGWCAKCGCGNDQKGYSHLAHCPAYTAKPLPSFNA